MFEKLRLIAVVLCWLAVGANSINYDEDVFDHDDLLGVPELHSRDAGQQEQRWLGGGENNQKYLVYDVDGVEYDPYSLAWRYLGIYIDCNADNGGGDNHNDHRRLGSHSNDNGGGCTRKLLWAAYVDNRYEGNTIEEYKFYDIATREWNNSTCLASGESHRCVKLNCHEPHTKFGLVGVFKETNGMYDWFEQLFKHQGTCIWNDNDVYKTMETWMEKFPTQCTKLSVKDNSGNTIYMSTHPLPEGNMTIGIYTDNTCLTLSEEIDYASYIVMYYQSYYEQSYYYRYYGYNSYYYRYYYEMGQEAAETYANAIDTWNEYMSQFKTCQPCKAYNLQWDQQKQNKHERRGRVLENEGDGSANARYNCYDEAGYTNVNQCYKFETKTKMSIAEAEDLEMASEQGTILRIKAYGKWYGEGGYVSEPEYDIRLIYVTVAAVASAMVAICACGLTRFCRRRAERRKTATLDDSLCAEEANSDEILYVKSLADHGIAITRTSPRRGKRRRRRRRPTSSRAGWWNILISKMGNDADTIRQAKSGVYTPPQSPSPSEKSDDSLPSPGALVDMYEVQLKEVEGKDYDATKKPCAGSWWNIFSSRKEKAARAADDESISIEAADAESGAYTPPTKTLPSPREIEKEEIEKKLASLIVMTEKSKIMKQAQLRTSVDIVKGRITPPLSEYKIVTTSALTASTDTSIPFTSPPTSLRESSENEPYLNTKLLWEKSLDLIRERSESTPQREVEERSEVSASEFVQFDNNPFAEINVSSKSGSSEAFIGDVSIDGAASDVSRGYCDGSDYSCTSSEAREREQLDHMTFLQKMRPEKKRAPRTS